jgi:hypothetical protein
MNFEAANVAQIFKLLYRRLGAGWARDVAARSETSNAPQITNLRYSRVQLCATWVAAELHHVLSRPFRFLPDERMV